MVSPARGSAAAGRFEAVRQMYRKLLAGLTDVLMVLQIEVNL
jgi:hypothetical protein